MKASFHWRIVAEIMPVVWWCTGLLAVLIFAATAAGDGFERVDGPCGLRFPEDHSVHEGYRTEWWYYTGNLTDKSGRPFGFQLTFFRTRLPAPAEVPSENHRTSAWRTPHIYLAHMAITDIDAEIHHFNEDMARGALGLAGVARSGDAVTVAVKKWSARITPRRHHLTADTEDMAMDLILTPEKQPVAHGDGGYSRKGGRPEQASCYYSFTRLAAAGTLRTGDHAMAVTGLAWMDHEFSTAPLDENLVGWDWLSLQLDNGSDVMLYRLRDAIGNMHPASSGTVVDAGGSVLRLSHDGFEMAPGKIWRSPASKGRYPVRWTVRIPRLNLTLDVSTPVAAQEMPTGRSTGVVYWEGSVNASGALGQEPVKGRGYLEMTGYAGAFAAPL